MLAPELIPSWGGVSTYIMELIRHLPERFEFTVLTTQRRSFGNSLHESIETSLDLRRGVNVLFISEAKDTFIYNGAFQYACWREVPRVLKKERIDLIHSHSAQMPDLLLRLRRINVPIVTTVHSTLHSQREATKASAVPLGLLERSEKFTFGMYPLLRAVEKAYFSTGRQYITPSRWMRKILERDTSVNDTIKVIPNSVNPSDYSRLESEYVRDEIRKVAVDSRMVLYCGRLLALKGVDTLIRAIPEVLKAIGDRVLFVFAGPGNPTRYMKEAQSMNIHRDSCLFTGPLTRKETNWLMKEAEVIAVPSFLENCPFSILESMACGASVVASNIGGIPEIITDNYNGLLVQPGHPKELSAAIVKLLENESMRRDIGENAMKMIEARFSWSANLEAYIDLYEEHLRA
jgi:glycosyltransferase involved in cell wall biosynthesis